MKSVMVHQFSMVPQAHIERSSFNRSHGLKTTFNSGYLVPIFIDEVLPGDTFRLRPTLFARLATPIVPIMDNLFLETFFFFVPNRLVWDNWQKMNGEQENPGDSTDYLVPMITAPSGGYQVGSIFDYAGLPTGVGGFEHSALPFRGINLIFNTWFRDENLQNSLPVPKGDSDTHTNYNLFRRGKRHDYFTSALPWPSKDGIGVEVPLGTVAPVKGLKAASDGGYYPVSWNNRLTNVSVGSGSDNYKAPAGEGSNVWTYFGLNDNTVFENGPEGVYADLSNASAATINTLRQAFQIQRLFERDARSGTRYTEILRSHFGVISPDARLQRPEYLGGSSTRINVSPVAQTSSSDSTTPQGNLSAFGVAGDSFGAVNKSFTEHGYIIGFVNVRADLTYQQGLNRMWSRQTRFDFYWPSLAHLGEQTILNKEIYCQGNESDEGVFGYQERYAEYRYKPSQITGQFRSTFAQSLDSWHLSQKFDNLPVLNDEFIQDAPPIDRVVAVPSEPQFLLDVYFDLQCVRPMPLYSVPGLIDHF